MESYAYISFLVRHGPWIAALACAGMLTVFAALLLGVDSLAFWTPLALAGAAVAGFLVMLLRDICRVIADTLIPAP